MSKLILPTLLLLLSPLLIAAQGLNSEGAPTKYETTTLLDEFGNAGECDTRARMDSFLLELQNNPGLQGYVITYQSLEVPIGRLDRLVYEISFKDHITYRRFDTSRIIFIHGGFRKGFANEYWVAPAGADPPKPKNSLPAPNIPTNSSFLYDKNYFYFDGETTILDDLVLLSVLDKENSELEVDKDNDEGLVDEEVHYLENDTRTPEEIEEARFRWVSIMFGDYLTKNPEMSGVIIYYADDEYYDLGKFSEFIQGGVSRITDTKKGAAGRINLIYGGYRSTPEVEYWVVPQNGKLPDPTPEARSSELEDEDQS